MKLFSFYLPQFHEIKENNMWWGKGFTEWTNVRNARPLFKGHNQPLIPLGGYYNLLDKKTVCNQTNEMKKYGIDGLIYYHYYFNGKLLLEKPAENLLEWKDIDQPFFFCWANHDWNRSWEGKKEVLLKQEYGDESDWERHFQYLLPFFRDKRYEKKNNMPLFIIFKSNFSQRDEMFRFFDKRCREEGFSGLYLIECYERTGEAKRFNDDICIFKKTTSTVTKDVFIREPYTCSLIYHDSVLIDLFSKIRRITLRKIANLIHSSYVYKINGDKLYEVMIKQCSRAKGIHGLFFEWDNTPRHKERGYVITHVSKSYFDKYMETIKNDEYVFVNAWNEWAEGMILEPTVKDGYRNLEWIFEWTKR